MLMCCIDEKAWTQLPDSEKHGIMQEYRALIQSLVTSGQFRRGGAITLDFIRHDRTHEGGKLALTDGRLRKPKSSSAATTWSNAATWLKPSPSRHVFRRCRRGGAIEVRSLEPSSESELSVSR